MKKHDAVKTEQGFTLGQSPDVWEQGFGKFAVLWFPETGPANSVKYDILTERQWPAKAALQLYCT